MAQICSATAFPTRTLTPQSICRRIFGKYRVTTDKHAAYPQAIQAVLGFTVIQRTNRYLNNRIEQDHRAIKQRYYPMRGFGSAAGAARFCTAYEELRQHFRAQTADSKPHSLAQKRQHLRQRCAELFAAWQVA